MRIFPEGRSLRTRGTIQRSPGLRAANAGVGSIDRMKNASTQPLDLNGDENSRDQIV
jgi:hypothetical protein